MMIHIMGEHGSKLTGVQPGDVQPNAVDLRLGKVFKILPNVCTLSETQKGHRGSVELQPDEQGFWHLEPGTYEVVMENIIEVGEGEAGWVITRSTLNRNGIFLTSGLYDSMYHGTMAGAMHVTTGPFSVQKGTRVGQFLLFKAEMLHAYNGSYGFDAAGKPKPEEEKYHV